MSDIAREAGVSKNTVSLVFKNDRQIPPRTAARIRKIATRLGYVKNATVARLMSTLRASRTPGARASLAILNANEDPEAFRRHATIPTYVAGCTRRAAALGYGLDEFWLHLPEMDGSRLNAMLRARGISGVLVVGLMETNRLPARFASTWRDFPCVVTGVRTHDPALSFACVDHHGVLLGAVEAVRRLGYRRPALVLDPVIDALVEKRFTAGFGVACGDLPPRDRIRPFHDIVAARRNPHLFRRWLDRVRPDVVLTLYREVHGWLEDAGLRIPRDIGLVQLEWREADPSWSGMHQHNDVTGEAAVEMLVAMIQNGESGIPAFPRATMIGSTWVEGRTTRPLA